MSKPRYLLFPIELLQKADIKDVCISAIHYGVYRRALDIADGETVKQQHIKEAMEFFGLIVNSLQNRLKAGKELHDTFSTNNPTASINKDLLIQFCNEEKTDFEVLTFRAFIALRSIIGMQALCKATDDYLIARMYGYRTIADHEADLAARASGSCIKPPLNRYQLDKIKKELKKNWRLVYYSKHVRGFFVSYKVDLDTLILHAEQKRETYKAKELKQKEDEAYQRVMKKLKKPP